MKKILKGGFCLYLLLLISSSSWAQNKTVSGKISDDKGVALSSASVTVKNSKIGTTTNVNGEFTLSVPSGTKSLLVSAVGYETSEIAIKEGPLSISLAKSDTKLEEVVIVGYGTQKKSVVTGAISSVKAKTIEAVPTGRIEQVLQGRVAGVTVATNSGQPGSPSTIRVRGVTTFGDGGNNPLYVVDGVVVDAGGIGYLNQSDIESIEVLKDAASAAIYGTRAATGVILVTTKKGKAGKMVVNYNGFYGVSQPAKMLDLLNATQYATLMNEKSIGGGGGVVYPNLSSMGTGTDWQKEIFNNSANRYSQELSLSGGNEKTIFYISFGMQDQEGIVATQISNYASQNFRINSTTKISKVFTFGQTLGYTHQKSTGIGNTNSEFGGPLSSAINLDPITPVVETNPAVISQPPYLDPRIIRDPNGNPYGISLIVGQEMTNPVAYQQTRLGGYFWSNDLIGNAFLDVNISSEFKFKTSIGGKQAFWGGQGFTPVFYLNPNNNNIKNNYGKDQNNSFNWNVENTLTYTKSIKDHNFTVLLGQGAYVENVGGGSSVNLSDLPVNNYQDASFNFNIPDPLNKVLGAWDFTEHKLSSLFARVNYNYKEKYLFNGIFRRDGSTRFGSNYKYGNFPGFSAGWVVSKEDFWNNNKYVNSLKVRAGYGEVGNDAIANFKYLALIGGGYNYTIGNSGTITTGYAPLSLENPDLQWEQTSQLDIGFDAILFKTMNLTVDYYNKKTNGILRDVNIPGYVGTANPPSANVADMTNSGIEVELGYQKMFKGLNFSAVGSFAYNDNTVTYVAADTNFIIGDAGFQSMGTVTRTGVGHSYNSFFGYQTDGIFQNMDEVNAYTNKTGGLIQPNALPGDFRWQDTNGDGMINADDKTYLGSSLPKYTFGLTLNADYKGFDFMIFFQGTAGSEIFQGLRRLDIANANYQTIAMSRWTGEGTSNTYPRLSSTDPNGNFTNMSNFYLEDGDYLRLKLMQVGYTLPAKYASKIYATKLRVYFTAQNLLTMTNYTGYDPEIGGGVYGIDKGVYPQARSFLFGLQLQF